MTNSMSGQRKSDERQEQIEYKPKFYTVDIVIHKEEIRVCPMQRFPCGCEQWYMARSGFHISGSDPKAMYMEYHTPGCWYPDADEFDRWAYVVRKEAGVCK